MKQIISSIAILLLSCAIAKAQCSSTPNNFEIQLLQNHQSKNLEIQIRHHQQLANNQLPTATTLLDGLVFAIASPANSNTQINECKSTNLGFKLVKDNNISKFKTANSSETITTFYHDNSATLPTAFTANWLQDTWLTVATITYSGNVNNTDFFSLVTCDYGLAHPNSYEGNSTTDPWFSLYNTITQSFDQYSPKMITVLPTTTFTANKIEMYPSPTSAIINANIIVNTESSLAIQVVDAIGKTVKIINTDVVAGENKISFSIAELPSGIYNVYGTDGKTIQLNAKIEKQ